MDKKIIVITGAANGISREIAIELDDANNIIFAIDNNEKIYDIKECFKYAELNSICMDASDEIEVKKIVNNIRTEYGKIDVLINGLAVVPYCPLDEQDYAKFIDIVRNNLGSYMVFSKEVSNVMRENNAGVIINISSISANFGINGQTAYASSKGGISALTRVLAVELGKHNIRVNAIAPGSIIVDRNREGMTNKWSKERIEENIPLGRLGEPSDVAGVVKFLMSSDAKYVHGTTIVVDGGMTIKGV